MNKRFLSVLAFALVVAGGASLLLYRLVASRLESGAKPASAKLLAAAHALEVGTLIKDGDLKSVDWPGPVPAQALTKKEDLLGRGVVATIYEGELILANRLAIRGAGAGLAATIPMGMRAVAVRVNEVVGVAGFVIPGMRVDVLVAGNLPGPAQTTTGTMTKTVLQNIAVLSAGQKIEKNAEGKPESVGVVNLLVTPEQAEVLSLASNETRIQLVLRNPLDTKEEKTPGTTVAALFSGGAPPPPQVAEQPVRMVRSSAPASARPKTIAEPLPVPIRVEMIHGSKITETSFRGDDPPSRNKIPENALTPNALIQK